MSRKNQSQCVLATRALAGASLAVAASFATLACAQGLTGYQTYRPSKLLDPAAQLDVQFDAPDWPRSGWEAENRRRVVEFEEKKKQLGANNPMLIPALMELAGWYRQTGQWVPARARYHGAIELMESAYGKDHLGLAEPLIDVAFTYFDERKYPRQGREALARVVSLYESAGGDYARDQAQALILLGDWYLSTGDPDKALATYGAAWKAMTDADDGSSVYAESMLGRPRRLGVLPIQAAGERPDATAEAALTCSVRLEFTVTQQGEVQDLSVVDSDVGSRVERQVRLFVSGSRYRPAFADGRPIASPYVLIQRFSNCAAGDSGGNS